MSHLEGTFFYGTPRGFYLSTHFCCSAFILRTQKLWKIVNIKTVANFCSAFSWFESIYFEKLFENLKQVYLLYRNPLEQNPDFTNIIFIFLLCNIYWNICRTANKYAEIQFSACSLKAISSVSTDSSICT